MPQFQEKWYILDGVRRRLDSMPHIFISYSRKDMDFAGKIVQALAEKEVDTWIDWKNIPKGEYWEQEIYRGIEEADAFLFLISPDSVRSRICNKEIAHAVINSKRILPIVVRDADVANFPEETAGQEIAKRNWIFCRDGQDPFHTAIEQTLHTLHTDYEWLNYHTKLQVQALEWERNNHEKSFLLQGVELQTAETQLAANSLKEPYPTNLQRDYVLRSRQATDRQRRITTGIAFAGMIVLTVLAVYAFIQAGRATTNAIEAQNNAVLANNQAGTAQAASTFAVAQQATAEANAQIALARQLVAQVQAINASKDSKQLIAVLLAIQSMKIFPSGETAKVLLNDNFAAHLVARMNHDGNVMTVAFSPDGKYVAAGDESTARVWEVSSGRLVSHKTHDALVESLAFSPDGKYVASAGGFTVNVWQANSGREILHVTDEEGYFTSVNFSPDGKYIVSPSLKTAHVWEVATGQEIATMTHEEQIISTLFSPDGKFVVSISTDNTARVWEALTGREVARVTHDNMVRSLALSPNGKYVVSGSVDKTARVWELSTGREIARMTHESEVTALVFSPDGNYIVSGSSDNTVRIWEASTGHEIARMAHDNPVTSVAFSPDGKYVVSGSMDFTARVWDVSGREIARMTHDGGVLSVAFSPDAKYVVSGSEDSTVRVWEAKTRMESARMTQKSGVVSFALSPDGKYVASAECGHRNENLQCEEGTSRVWEVETGEEISSLTHTGLILSVAFSPDGKYVASGDCSERENTNLAECAKGTIRIWEAATGQEVLRMTDQGSASRVAFSSDGRYVLSVHCHKTRPLNILGFALSAIPACDEDVIRIWDAATGAEINHITYSDNVTTVAFSPDSKYIVVGSWDRTARVWEVLTGREIARMTHDHWVEAVAFSPDGHYVVSGSQDKTARVWEALTGREVARMTHDAIVQCVAFSPDGKYVVSGSDDRTARVWEAATGREVSHFFHEAGVESAVFSPDGHYVVSGGHDNTARIWETSTGREIARMIHGGAVYAVAFSPDGRYMVSGSSDNTLRVWKWKTDDLIQNACAYLPRNLTLAEWKEYMGDAVTYQAVCPNLPMDPIFLADIARPILSNAKDHDRVQNAFKKVMDILRTNSNSDILRDQANQALGDVIEEQIVRDDLAAGNINPSLGLLKDAKEIGIEIDDAEKLDSICWYGSLWGYVNDVLEYCEKAVDYSPDDSSSRYSRELARALTGQPLDPSLNDAGSLNSICWDASLHGYAAQVLEICERAVKYSTDDNPSIRDSRGLARALTGNFPGAIEDFQFFVENTDLDETYIQQRIQWIQDLKNGVNPFTAEVLEELSGQ